MSSRQVEAGVVYKGCEREYFSDLNFRDGREAELSCLK